MNQVDKAYSANLEEIATYGFDAINPEETVEVNLKDLMYVYATLQEYQRFFHQPQHYPSLEHIERFLGSVNDKAGYALLHTALHQKMRGMLPRHIEDKYAEGDFDCPKLPFYYQHNNL